MAAVLGVRRLYLAKHPDSVYSINIKACNHYKLYNGAAAETVRLAHNSPCTAHST